MGGATFTLYKVDTDGTDTIKVNGADINVTEKESKTSDPDFTSPNGVAVPGGAVFDHLDAGEYYLMETAAPEGYQINSTPVHVIVDETGIYADAGTMADDVTVRKSVGSIMGSMEQFAEGDAVDITLNNIKAALAVANTQQAAKEAAWPGGTEMHLEYTDRNNTQDYGPHDKSAPTVEHLTLATETGWSKLMVRQCNNHDTVHTAEPPHYENLGNQDLTALFSGITLVQVSDVKKQTLTISKKVTGEDANRNQTFTLNLTNDNGALLTDPFEFETEGSVTDAQNKAVAVTPVKDTAENVLYYTGSLTSGCKVQLKRGRAITIKGLMPGTEFDVTETSVDGYDTKVYVNGAQVTTGQTPTGSGTIVQDMSATVTFENAKKYDLKLSKTVTAAEGVTIPTDDTFTFTVTLTDANGNALAGSFETVSTRTDKNGSVITDSITSGGTLTLYKDETVTILNIPKGATYTVEESAVTAPGFSFGSIAIDRTSTTNAEDAQSVSGTMGEADAAVTCTNNYESHNLTLKKEVVGANAPAQGFEFTVTVTDAAGNVLTGFATQGPGKNEDGTPVNGTLAADGKVTLKHNETVTILNIPKGATYTVEESTVTAPGFSFGSIAIDDTGVKNTSGAQKVSGTMDGTDAAVTCTNNYESHNLTLTKQVNGTNAPDNVPFTFTITLDEAMGTVTPVYSNPAVENPQELDFSTNGTATVTLVGGQSVTIPNVPKGLAYTVEERAVTAPGFSFGSIAIDRTGTTNAEGAQDVSGTMDEADAAVTCTNNYNTGTLVITKTQKADTEDWDTDQTFSFKVETVGADGEADTQIASFVLKKNETAQINDLPVGTTYRITETNLATGFTCTRINTTAPANGKAPTADVTITSGTQNVTFENQYETVSLNVTKAMTQDSDYVMPDMTFGFTVTIAGFENKGDVACTLEDGTSKTLTFGADGSASFTLCKDQTLTIPGIPKGAGYTVTEDAQTGAYSLDSVASTDSAAENDKDNRKTSGTLSAQTTATFTNKYVAPRYKLTLVKKAVNNGNTTMPNASFTFDVTLTEPGKAAVKHVVTLKADETKKFENLPEGTVYSITEKNLPDRFALAGTLTVVNGVAIPGEAMETDGTVKAADVAVTYTNAYAGPTPTPTATPTATPTPEAMHRLTIAKAVTGEGAPADAAFMFAVTIEGMENRRLEVSLNDGQRGVLTFDANGTAAFGLTAGMAVTIPGLLDGTAYTVAEQGMPERFRLFEVRVDYGGAAPAVRNEPTVSGGVDGSDVTVVYTNEYMTIMVPMTGDRQPLALCTALALLCGALLLCGRRRDG